MSYYPEEISRTQKSPTGWNVTCADVSIATWIFRLDWAVSVVLKQRNVQGTPLPLPLFHSESHGSSVLYFLLCLKPRVGWQVPILLDICNMRSLSDQGI